MNVADFEILIMSDNKNIDNCMVSVLSVEFTNPKTNDIITVNSDSFNYVKVGSAVEDYTLVGRAVTRQYKYVVPVIFKWYDLSFSKEIGIGSDNFLKFVRNLRDNYIITDCKFGCETKEVCEYDYHFTINFTNEKGIVSIASDEFVNQKSIKF